MEKYTVFMDWKHLSFYQREKGVDKIGSLSSRDLVLSSRNSQSSQGHQTNCSLNVEVPCLEMQRIRKTFYERQNVNSF